MNLFFYNIKFDNVIIFRIFVLSDWGNDLDTTIRKKIKKRFGRIEKLPYLCKTKEINILITT